jgi:hypothetical protein
MLAVDFFTVETMWLQRLCDASRFAIVTAFEHGA